MQLWCLPLFSHLFTLLYTVHTTNSSATPTLGLNVPLQYMQQTKQKITCINVIIIELLEFSIACHCICECCCCCCLFSCWWFFTMYVCVMSHKFYFCLFLLYFKKLLHFIVGAYMMIPVMHITYSLLSAFFACIWLCFMFNMFVECNR